MNIVFRLIIALGIPLAVYLMLGANSAWIIVTPSAPAVFLFFWLLLWLHPLWQSTRMNDGATYANLLKVLSPSLILLGVAAGLAASIFCAIGHPYGVLTNSPIFLGLAVFWAVICLTLPGLLGGYSKPLPNAGAVADPREGMMVSHAPPVTSMPLSDHTSSRSDTDDTDKE